jgi:hypothetical protein
MSAQVVEDEDYQLRYEIVAGIDVAKESAVVCVRMPPAEGKKHRTSHLRTVPATVPAIGKLAADLKAAGVQMVSMESDYWRVWFAVLEEAGLAVQLVNSCQARNLPGRPKTDKEDARWIDATTFGVAGTENRPQVRPYRLPSPSSAAQLGQDLRCHRVEHVLRSRPDSLASRPRSYHIGEPQLTGTAYEVSIALNRLE